MEMKKTNHDVQFNNISNLIEQLLLMKQMNREERSDDMYFPKKLSINLEKLNKQSSFCCSTLVDDYINKVMHDIIFKSNKYEEPDKYLIYIAGPVSKVPDWEKRFENTIEVVSTAEQFSDKNIYIVNPMEYSNNFPENINATFLERTFLDYSMLGICDAIVFDDTDNAWLNSRGCIAELTYAFSNDIDIYSVTKLNRYEP